MAESRAGWRDTVRKFRRYIDPFSSVLYYLGIILHIYSFLASLKLINLCYKQIESK